MTTRAVRNRFLPAITLAIGCTAWLSWSHVDARAESVPAIACIQCASGSGVGCSSGWHKAWDDGGPDNDASGETHDECKCCNCSTAHPPCAAPLPEGEISPFEVVETVETAIARSDVVTLAKVLVNYGENVDINGARGAIQVSICTGTVVAHLPISEEHARAVESAAAEQE